MGKQIRDLTGQIFERWTVIAFDRFVGKKPSRRVFWLCECICGTRKSVWMGSLVTGLSKSCGCWKIDHPGRKTHGLSKTNEYDIWAGMIQRCYYTKAINYARYGGRGVRVCKRWRKFENFFADMGKRPSPESQLDRKKNHLGYSPGNCRWVTSRINNRNTRRSVRLTFKGEVLTVPEWAERLGLPERLIHGRLRLKWSVEKTLTEPLLQPTTITFNNQAHTISAWEKLRGMRSGTLKYRLSCGWSVKRALSEELHLNHGRNRISVQSKNDLLNGS